MVLPDPAERFLSTLKATRRPATCRSYRSTLRSLHGWLSQNSVDLSNLNRGPIYLPRPLPPAQGDTLQRRLEASEDQLHQALLLMRRTGLRIGELQDLSYNCVQRDQRGSVFLLTDPFMARSSH